MYIKCTYVHEKRKKVLMKKEFEKNLMPIEYGLDSKIYYLAYEQAKSGYQISQEIYGYYHYSINKKIKKLKNQGYFLPIQISGKKNPYWISNVKPIIDLIELFKKDEGIYFSDLDKHILHNFMDSEAFRKLATNIEEFNSIRGDFNATDIIMMKLDMFCIEFLNSESLSKIGRIIDNIKTIDQFDTFINESKKSFDKDIFEDVLNSYLDYKQNMLNDPIPKILKDEKEMEDLQKMFVEKMIYFFYFPKKLVEKVIGLTMIGQMEPVLKGIFKEASGIDRFTEYLDSK
jgi:biotin operon repressor